MHAHDVDAKRLSVHMGELQRAHVLQNRVIQELEEGLGRMPLIKSTVRKQEKVIAGLEDLLRKAVQQVKCMRDAEETLRRERQSVEDRLAEADRRAADAEQRVVASDHCVASYKARLQAAYALAPVVQAGGVEDQQLAAAQPAPVQSKQHPKRAEVVQQGEPDDLTVSDTTGESVKVLELEQKLHSEQRECEDLRRQLEGEQADKETLRRQQANAIRESSTMQRNVAELEQQLVQLRQQVATAASDTEALKAKADASDAAAAAADSDLAYVRLPAPVIHCIGRLRSAVQSAHGNECLTILLLLHK